MSFVGIINSPKGYLNQSRTTKITSDFQENYKKINFFFEKEKPFLHFLETEGNFREHKRKHMEMWNVKNGDDSGRDNMKVWSLDCRQYLYI